MSTEQEHVCFESAAQMAGWLHYGGKIKSKTGYEYDANDCIPICDFDYYHPVGELPENWCRFQNEIDKREAEREWNIKIGKVDNFLGGLYFAKAELLKSIDPRLSRKP